MTTYAIADAVTAQLPYLIIRWVCVPPCGAEVAVTRLDSAARKVETWTTQFKPVHIPKAGRDGLPFFGPGSRERRGKSTRRHPAKLANESVWRSRRANASLAGRAWADSETARRLTNETDFVIAGVASDYSAIEVEEFDTVCTRCSTPTRLRIRLASAVPA